MAESGGYDVRRAYLDGQGEEVLLSGMPPQTRVHAAALSANGLLSTVYIGVSQPGNASLLLYVEAKEATKDAYVSNTSLVTLLRDVAPTALTQHGSYFYYSIAVAQAIRRCDLNGRHCITVHSTARDRNREAIGGVAALPWIVPPRAGVGAPAGLSLDPTGGSYGLVWVDQLADRVFRSTPNGSDPEALWWPRYHPVGVELSVEGAAAEAPQRATPTIFAITPLGGPVEGNSSITVHGLSLGGVREVRYIRESVWPSPASAGVGLAFLPKCHADCPQSTAHITYLDDDWRAMRNATNSSYNSDGRCDNLPPYTRIAQVSGRGGDDPRLAAANPERTRGGLAAAGWFQFRGRAGVRMHSNAPEGGRCGAEAAGWMNGPHPRAGDKPLPSTACFAFGWSDCLWSAEMLTCACSYDGGASTIYSYKLPMPPGDPTCVSYCGEGVNEQEYESEGRRMQERYGQAMGGDTATPYITSTRRTGDGGPPMTLEEELAEADAQRFLQTSARVQEEARRAIEERDIHAPAFAALLNDTNSSEWDSYSSYGPNLERTRPPGKPGDPPWLDVNRSAMLTVSRDEMDRPGTPTPTTDQQMLWTITYDTDGNQIRTPRPRPIRLILCRLASLANGAGQDGRRRARLNCRRLRWSGGGRAWRRRELWVCWMVATGPIPTHLAIRLWATCPATLATSARILISSASRGSSAALRQYIPRRPFSYR